MASKNPRCLKFKNNGKDADEMRRRRVEVSVELRKTKREEHISKRRNVTVDNAASCESEDSGSPNSLSLNSLMGPAIYADPEIQFYTIQFARKMLSGDKDPPIDDMIESGILPIFVQCLTRSDRPLLQFEAVWALTNIASGTSAQTQAVIDSGAVPNLVTLLQSPHQYVCEQAVWALGNIIGDNAASRDFVISQGAVQRLLNLANDQVPLASLSNVTWALSNLCRYNNPSLPKETALQLLPVTLDLLRFSEPKIIVNVLWMLAYLIDGKIAMVQKVVDSQTVPRLVALLSEDDINIQRASLRVVGNIATGTSGQTEALLNCHALNHFSMLLSHPKKDIVKEALWCLSNILVGPYSHLKQVIDCGLVPQIIHLLDVEEYQIQKEAAWAVNNLTLGCGREKVMHMVELGVVRSLCKMLEVKDVQMTVLALNSLKNIFIASQNCAPDICQMVEEYGGLDKLQNLTWHENDEIFRTALGIINCYFREKEELTLQEDKDFNTVR